MNDEEKKSIRSGFKRSVYFSYVGAHAHAHEDAENWAYFEAEDCARACAKTLGSRKNGDDIYRSVYREAYAQSYDLAALSLFTSNVNSYWNSGRRR